VSATWSGAVTDDETPLSFWWCAGSVPGGCDVLPPTFTGGASNGRAIVNASLAGRTLYATVTAVNAAGLALNLTSDGVTYDDVAPAAGRIVVMGAVPVSPPPGLVSNTSLTGGWSPSILYINAAAPPFTPRGAGLKLSLQGWATVAAPLTSFAV